jgi:RND family efflux transporter MFP subunit
MQTAPPDHSRKRSPWLGWFAGTAVILVVMIGIAVWFMRPPGRTVLAGVSAHGHTAEGAQDDVSDAVYAEVVKPEPGGITRTSTQVGSVHAYEDADLYAKVSGYLRTLNVDIGDRVKQGDVLAVIDDPELVKERDHAAAVLKQSRAAVKQAEAVILNFAAQAKKAEAEVARYTSNRKYREKELARYQGLYEQKAVPRAVVDEMEDHLEAARSSENASISEAVAAQASVDRSKADKYLAETTVDVSKANLDKMEELVKYLEIKSPYTGVVTVRNVHPGDFIRSAADGKEKPLLNVARTDKLRVVTYVPDRDVPYVDAGDPAEVALDALNASIPGKVWRFADTEDPESRTMRTEILLENKDGKVRQGMFGQATIYLENTKAALSVPADCLVGESKNGVGSVLLVRDGKAQKTEVKVGANDGIRVEILKGLTAGDLVIENVSAISDGMPVKVAEKGARKAPQAAGHGN